MKLNIREVCKNTADVVSNVNRKHLYSAFMIFGAAALFATGYVGGKNKGKSIGWRNGYNDAFNEMERRDRLETYRAFAQGYKTGKISSSLDDFYCYQVDEEDDKKDV